MRSKAAFLCAESGEADRELIPARAAPSFLAARLCYLSGEIKRHVIVSTNPLLLLLLPLLPPPPFLLHLSSAPPP